MTLDFWFGGYTQTFRAVTIFKVCFFRPKMIPKQLLNNSKTTFKKSKKQIFGSWKMSKLVKMTMAQRPEFHPKKSWFWWLSNFIWGRYYTQVWACYVLKQCPNNLKTTLKKVKFCCKIRLTRPNALQTISIILFLINFYQKARSNKTETYIKALNLYF